MRRTVADCRRAVFGREQAPFATYDDARTWLEAQQRKCRYTGPQWSDRCVRAWERDVRRFRRIRSDWRASLSFRFNGVPVVFWTDENGWPIGLPAYTPKLCALWHGTEDLAGLTGWSSPSALAYLLAGVVPAGRREPQVKWKMFGDQAGAFLVDVRLWPWHLNRQGVASILEYVRRWGNALPPMRKLATLRFTDKERRLLDLVADQGPPPPGRWKARRGKRKEYFGRLALLWKQAYGERISLNALRKMWERIRPRYENAIAKRPRGW